MIFNHYEDDIDICISRETVWQDTLKFLKQTPPETLVINDYHVKFKGEEGIDA